MEDILFDTFCIYLQANRLNCFYLRMQNVVCAESIDATLKIIMLDKKGHIVLTDSTNIAGLEMVGDYKSLQGLLK